MERARKRELRTLNTRSWNGEKDVLPVGSSLDSSMKKNTAFIRRLRTLNASVTATVLQEVSSLSLHKYLSEIISACYEGLTRLKTPVDIAAGVEVFSALHQRFGPEEFTCPLAWYIGRGLSSPDKVQLKSLPQDVKEREEKERLGRHRVLLRVATELWLVSGLRSLDDVSRPEDVSKIKENIKPPSMISVKANANTAKSSSADAEPFPLEVLKEITMQDGQHANLGMIASWAKTFTWDLLGKQDDAEQATIQDTALVEPNLQQRFQNVLERYFEGAKQHLTRDQMFINNQSRRNAEAYVRSGEIFEDRQANHEKLLKTHEKFVANMTSLSELLGTEMPDLKEKEATSSATDSAIGLVKTGDYLRGQGDGAGIWDDEEERRFYENLIDLKDRVPSILLEDNRKRKPDSEEQVGKRSDDNKSSTSSEAADATKENQSKVDSELDQSTAIANKTVGAQVDALLARLADLTNKESVDDLAIDFCFLNSKASRNRLIKAVQEIPKGRTDLLPLYSRLVTTLGRYLQDISQSLVSHLDDEFRSLQRRKQKDSLGAVRTSNIRYLAELTKFGLVPEHVVFHSLKVSLDDFSKMNIEIICIFLENCGKYLLRNPETAPRMRSFLDTLQRKKSAQHLGQQERMLVENAMYSVDPPERAAIQQKERTPLDLFVRKLVYIDLNKRNVERVIKQIRKLHWEEDEVVNALHKVFVRPYKIKFSNIHFLAIMLGSLNRYHQDFSVGVIDDLLESITVGLEQNEFKFNQRRLAEVRYLGELYVYRMVDSSMIFDTMYKIATFGHGGWPKPGLYNPLDPSDDFFRLRLICTILEACGMYYEKGAAKKKLDFFLTFFQYYIRTKDPMPMDVEFVVQDAFALVRPQWKIAPTLEDAGYKFAEACKENFKSYSSEKAPDMDETEEIDEDAEPRNQRSPAPDGENSSDETQVCPTKLSSIPERPLMKSQESEQGSYDSPDAGSDEENIVVTRPEDERDPEADAEFERELAKMMAESVETRKSERRPVLDVALPMRRAVRDGMGSEDSTNEAMPSDASKTKFSLLSKRGNRPQTRELDLPSNSSFAVAHRNQREAEKAEQQRIKKLVLNYDLRSDDTAGSIEQDGDNTSSHYLLQPNPNLRFPLCQSRDGQRAETRRRSPDAELSERAQSQPPLNSSGRDGAPATGLAGVERPSAQGGQKGPKRGQQQARKLQLSDVDWYDRSHFFPSSGTGPVGVQRKKR